MTRRAAASLERSPSRETPLVASVLLTTRGGPFVGVSRAALHRRAIKMLEHLELRGAELSVALVDDATIRELNRDYRHKDKPTDVLAFPQEEAGAGATQGGPATAHRMLGDVILSIDTGRRQAARHRRPLLAELTMLLAHGLLHLLGHDHQNDREEREMTARTRELEAVSARRGPGNKRSGAGAGARSGKTRRT